MAEFKEISPNAIGGEKLTNWFENRFPTAFEPTRSTCAEYYAPKNFNFWYIFGSLAMLVLVIQIVTGIFLVMHYKPDAALAFALGGIHHARCAMGLADPLHALHWRFGLLCRGLSAHVPWPDLRQLPQAARVGLDLWLRDFPVPDGRSLHGLSAALGPDELLGRPGDREPVCRHSLRWSRSGVADSWRLSWWAMQH